MIDVEYLDHMGNDLTVVNAARVSFDKESTSLSEQDKKLINYLAKHKHKSPFNHCFASFRVKAPIFVARQLQKHEYLVWNEVSRRYVDSEPAFFYPYDGWRIKAENVKQGSSNDLAPYEINGEACHLYNIAADNALDAYTFMINNGIAAEQARMVLPQSMMTTWIWSGSLGAFAKMCSLRLDPHSQYETRLVAEKVAENLESLFPVSFKALMENPFV